MKNYYNLVRVDIAQLLPERFDRVLDVGCGAGETLRWIKEQRPNVETVGLELNAAVLPRLKENADKAVVGDAANSLHEIGKFDLILMLDVLEHMSDPYSFLGKIRENLSENGYVIVSVPNISNIYVSANLLFRRRFDYQDSGIMDRTHMRFFVEKSAVGMLHGAGYFIDKGLISGLHGRLDRFLNGLSFGTMKHHLAKQYIMRAHNRTHDARPWKWQIYTPRT